MSQYGPENQPAIDYINRFLDSRKSLGVTESTFGYYKDKLGGFINSVDLTHLNRATIRRFLESIPANRYGLGNRRTYYRVLRTFFKWLNTEYDLPNMMEGIPAPIMAKPILPSLSAEQVHLLISKAHCTRDKAIIACFTESGLRLSELVHMTTGDMDWEAGTIRTLGKGRKKAYAPFGQLTRLYLSEWLKACPSVNGSSVWGMNNYGVKTLLRRLETDTGLTCNPHTFRRTFASLLRKAGIDSMTIKDLGRWSSVSMVEHYTRSVTFQDSMRFYRSPLG